MVNLYMIIYIPSPKTLPRIAYTDSFYIQDRIGDLLEWGLCRRWIIKDKFIIADELKAEDKIYLDENSKTEDKSDIPVERIKPDKDLDGGPVEIDKRWGVAKKRWATSNCT